MTLPKQTERDTEIRVVILRPGQQPEVNLIANQLSAFQHLVEGEIEVFAFGGSGSPLEPLCGVCHKDYIAQDFEPTCYVRRLQAVISGTFIITAYHIVAGNGQEFRSLSDEEIETIQEALAEGRELMPIGIAFDPF